MGFSFFREALAFAQISKLGMPANVWFDISATAMAYAGSPAQAELVWTMRQIGTDRILFGTDWPVDLPADAERAVRGLGLNPDEQKQIFHDNAAALFGLH
jgi:predicted TIM-barrel fold metal-dependent hydrolase